MNIMFKKASLEDAADVGYITSQSWQAAYSGIVPDDYLKEITPEFRTARFNAVFPLLTDAEFFLVLVDGKPVGVMNLHLCRDEDAKECGEIGIFYFLQEYWGKGYAAAAMDFALSRLRERGFSDAVLWVLEENCRARRFYEKQGFIIDGASKIINLGKDLVDVRYRRNIG